MNSIGGSKKGKAELSFADNSNLYTIENPEVSIENLLSKTQV